MEQGDGHITLYLVNVRALWLYLSCLHNRSVYIFHHGEKAGLVPKAAEIS